MLTKKFFLTLSLFFLLLCLRPDSAHAQGTTIRWDIARLDNSVSPPSINEGGQGNAGAIRSDGLIEGIITISGSGTFVDPNDPAAVTGGGSWSTIDPLTDHTTGGTFIVESLVKYSEAPGTLSNPNDNIGDPSTARAGVAVFLIWFSDGSEGTLTVSARFDDSPHAMIEGIAVTKDFMTYSDMRGFDSNQAMTIFHYVP